MAIMVLCALLVRLNQVNHSLNDDRNPIYSMANLLDHGNWLGIN